MGADPTQKLVVIAVGGNALIREKGRESLPEQYAAASLTMKYVADIIEIGWKVVITHGNGPQVGFVLRRSELTEGKLFNIPLDYCGSNTQGSIGYMFQMALMNEFHRRDMPNLAATVLTQTLVDRNDPAFDHPTKPIGSFMDEETAKKHAAEDHWSVVEDSGRGWRRVVASPAPIRIIQQGAILSLVQAGVTVIGVGGGGIPVVEDEQGNLMGVEAVIDKDLASALLAAEIGADLFLISTEVEKVALNFNTPDCSWIDSMTATEAYKYLTEGHFGKGSMEPKILAALNYLLSRGNEVLITNPEHMVEGLSGRTGTRITAAPF